MVCKRVMLTFEFKVIGKILLFDCCVPGTFHINTAMPNHFLIGGLVTKCS